MTEKEKHGGILNINDNSLGKDEWLVSENKKFKMGVQDGRLVVVDTNSGSIISASDVHDGATQLYVDEDDWVFDDDVGIALTNDDGDEVGDDLLQHETNMWKNNSLHQLALTNDGRVIVVYEDHELDKDGKWDGEYPKDKDGIFEGGLGLKSMGDPAFLKKVFGDDYKPGKPGDINSKSDVKDFQLVVQKPDGDSWTVSDPLSSYIDSVNRALASLSHVMGTGDIEPPDFLKDKVKNDDGKVVGQADDLFEKKLLDRLEKYDGKSVTSEIVLLGDLGHMAKHWNDVDEKFKKDVFMIDQYNDQHYKKLYSRVLQINEEIAASTIKQVPGVEKDTRDAGIQHLSEEAPLYRIITRGFNDCKKIVNEYVDDMLKMAKAHPEYEHLINDGKNDPGKKKDKEEPKKKEEEKPGKKEEEKPGDRTTPPPTTTTTTPPPTATTPPPTATTPPPTATTPPATPVNADDALNDLNKQYDKILGDSTEKPTNGSETTGDDGERSPSGATGQSVAGGQNTGGTPPPQNAVQTPLPPGGSPDMNGILNAVMAQKMFGEMGADQQGKDGKDKDKDKDDPRGQGRETPAPGQPSPGVAPGPTDQGPGVQPAVTAPTDTGTPPVVMTPGTSVDYKPYEGYKAPDGKGTVAVPQAASEALTRQAGNPALNAFTAYEGTQASQDMGGTWKSAEGELRTGDVVRWENHSAVLFNDGTGPQYWKDSQLVRLDQNGDLDNLGHGKFVGFLRPQGLGEADEQQPAAPPGLPKPEITMSTPQAPPSVQAPQEPKAI